eukprot:8641706-Alexandrium_andersonii.AAC.1
MERASSWAWLLGALRRGPALRVGARRRGSSALCAGARRLRPLATGCLAASALLLLLSFLLACSAL